MSKPKKEAANDRVVAGQFISLLPAQILLAFIPSLNGIISGLFGSNMLGEKALTAIGMYAPAISLLGAFTAMMSTGAQILCGNYMGKNRTDSTQQIFSLDLAVTALVSFAAAALLIFAGMFGLTGFMNPDPEVISMFNGFIIGTAIGIPPMMLANQLSGFLSMEMQGQRSSAAMGMFVVINFVMTWLFLRVLHMEAFGLALAGAVGYWICFLYQAAYYFTGKSMLKMKFTDFAFKDLREIAAIGFPGALTSLYLAVRRIVLNSLMMSYAGNAGMSAFAASDTLLQVFWSIPFGMAAVGRILMSVSAGEEDRQTLRDIFRILVTKCLIVVTVMAAFIILMAVPFTNLYYHDPSEPVYEMTVTALRLLPLSMPLGLICLTWSNYAQVMRKQVLIHTLSLIDGALAMCASAMVLVPSFGMTGVYLGAIFNGVVTVIYPLLFSAVVNRGIPKNADQLLMIPDDFGVPEEERLDLSLESCEEAMNISKKIQDFCLEKGIDKRRSYISALCLEEMAATIIDTGFAKDNKPHSVDVRVVHKDDSILLRIKDDCQPLNPEELAKIVDPDDITKNIGVRIVYSIANEVSYQNMLGLNVLTARI